MGVIVKGMDMPKNCDDCFFIERGYPDWCSLPQIPNGEDEIDDTKKRPDWCPLIELPEKHGRLIDADEMTNEWDGCTYDGSVTLLLETRPTVIEAEGDDE